MKQFKLRASAAGKLATNARSKGEILSETSKTYLKEWLAAQIYGFEKQIKSKYIEKGIYMEDESIDFAIRQMKLEFRLKNEQNFEDDFFTGTPDLILNDSIIDTKNSWDCFSFPIFERDIPTSDYFYQLQVYMHLTGKTKAQLVYVLLDTPATNYEPGMIYNIPDNLRIKSFEVEYEPEVIEGLKSKVIAAREYISELIINAGINQ